MTPTSTVILILCSALLNAVWNAFLHASQDRLWQACMMSVPTLFISSVAACWLPLPIPATWPLIILSAMAQFGYTLALNRAYQTGEFGQSYPIARGISPLLVTIAALVMAGESPGWGVVGGIIFISVGILSLAFRGRRISVESVSFALLTGVFVAAYTVIDGFGMRMSGNGFSYIAWAYLLGSAPLVTLVYLRRGGLRGMFFVVPARRVVEAFGASIIALISYTIALFSLRYLPMGVVSALREFSILFAVLLGWLFLKEPLTVRRLISGGLVVMGAMLIKLDV